MAQFAVTLYLRGGATIQYGAEADSLAELQDRIQEGRSQSRFEVLSEEEYTRIDADEIVGYTVKAVRSQAAG